MKTKGVGLKMKVSPRFVLNLCILLILGSIILNNLVSFDLSWSEPMETHVDFSNHLPLGTSIHGIYPLKIQQTHNSVFFGIWYVEPEVSETYDYFFFGSTYNLNYWSNFIPLEDIFSDFEGSFWLRTCDFAILKNDTIALFGIATTIERVNNTAINKNNLVMSLSNDGGLSWNEVVQINSTDLPSGFGNFGVFLDNKINFWTIEEDFGGEVTSINIWTFNESTSSIAQTQIYQPSTKVRIYRGAVTFNQDLIFLTRGESINHLLIFDGTQWDQIPISLVEDDLERLAVLGSDLFLIYTLSYDVFCIGKVHISDQEIKIADSTKIVSGLNWASIWPIQNSTVSTFYLTTHRGDIASIKNSFNWSTVIFTFLFCLVFVFIYISPILGSYYSGRKEK